MRLRRGAKRAGAAALAALALFGGCGNIVTGPDEDEGAGVLTAPEAEDLPALPEGFQPVDTQEAALALLGTLAAVSTSIRGAVDSEIGQRTGYDGTYNFTNITRNGVIISARSPKTAPPSGSFSAGDKLAFSGGYASKGVAAVDKAAGSASVLTGSAFEKTASQTIDLLVIQAGTMGTARFQGTFLSKTHYVYGLSAITEGEAGARIILDALKTQITVYGTAENGGYQETLNTIWIGSLKVYGGSSASPVYTLLIRNVAGYREALRYFGIDA
jgi:hypothetical protein